MIKGSIKVPSQQWGYLKYWGYLTTMRLHPKTEAASQQQGCLTRMRIPRNIEAPHNDKATLSQQSGYITTMRLHRSNEATPKKWGYLITLRLPHNNEATSQQWGYLTKLRLPHNIETTYQQWSGRQKSSKTAVACSLCIGSIGYLASYAPNWSNT